MLDPNLENLPNELQMLVLDHLSPLQRVSVEGVCLLWRYLSIATPLKTENKFHLHEEMMRAAEKGNLKNLTFLCENFNEDISNQGEALQRTSENGHVACAEYLLNKYGNDTTRISRPIKIQAKRDVMLAMITSDDIEAFQSKFKLWKNELKSLSVLFSPFSQYLSIAIQKDQAKLMCFLLENSDFSEIEKEDALVSMVEQNSPQCLMSFLKKYGEQIKFSMTMHLYGRAGVKNHVECLAVLLEKMKANAACKYARDVAIERGYVQCVALLEKALEEAPSEKRSYKSF